jgi:NAD(P)-dependent dehydrogenase (short-subunit alcohol dehydrogenase family)
VIPFRDEEEAVRLANDTIYGLSGSIWTRDGARALRVARGVEAGVLSINSNTSVRVATPVDTPLLRELYAQDPEQAARRLVHVPMGRFGRAEEIAAAALFLASDDASFVTAQALLVDGGIAGAYTTPQ